MSCKMVHLLTYYKDRHMKMLKLQLIICQLLSRQMDIFGISFCMLAVLLFMIGSFCLVCSLFLMVFIFFIIFSLSFSFYLRVFSFCFLCHLPFCIILIILNFLRNLSCIFRFAHLLLIFSLFFESLSLLFFKNLENILLLQVMVMVQMRCYMILLICLDYLLYSDYLLY